MAPVCTRFVQNAWKKDMCSNCFRSKLEHNNEKNIIRKPVVTKNPVKGIIRSPNKQKNKKRTVSFSPDPVQIIGQGGEEWSDDEGILEDNNSGSSEEDYTAYTEDKELEKITKSNTDYNTNLLVQSAIEKRRTFTQLMLGKTQTDAEGNKQTLLVSVTPFGQDENKETTRKITRSHIPIAKNKDVLVEKKPNVVLTSYTKNNKESTVGAKLINETNKIEKINEINLEKKDMDNNNIVSNNNNEIIPEKEEMSTEVEETSEEKSDIAETNKLLENEIKPPLITEENLNEEIKATENKPQVETVKQEKDIEIDPVNETEPETSLPTLETTSTINSELVKTRTELTIQLASVETDSDECESLTVLPKESREQAGEPDGRADPDVVNEPPALPLTPPPPLLNPRISFLHGSPKHTPDKPKIPSKPDKVMQIFKKVTDLPPLPNIYADPSKSNKRRAPNPPPSPVITDSGIRLESRNGGSVMDLSTRSNGSIIEPLNRSVGSVMDLSLIRNSGPNFDPSIRNGVLDPMLRNSAPNGSVIDSSGRNNGVTSPEPLMIRCSSLPENHIDAMPEPLPRRALSASQENLLLETEKPKSKKFSLKKLLRVGGKHSDKQKDKEPETKNLPPQVKPRLVIVHPMELNSSNVEVVRQEEVLPPAPPPRNIPVERAILEQNVPATPPPKSEELMRKQHHLPHTPAHNTRPSSDNVYANLGEVRSGLTPCKPQRTASMREREALLEQRRRTQSTPTEHLYERVQPRHPPDSPSRYKTTSLPAQLPVGGDQSETETVYSTCSYYPGSESEVAGEGEWGGCSRPCKLRCRKGRSIVHRNLEDNYGAVVVANREALAQVLENLHQTPSIQPALRGLQTASVLRWTDFSVVDLAAGITVGKRTFYHGLWGPHHVTLALSREQSSMHKPALGSFTMFPVTEFSDLVPGRFLGVRGEEESELVQASVSVLQWMHIETVQSFGSSMRTRFAQGQNEEVQREVSFILLQLINGLKSLQALGTEEVPLSLNNLVLCRDADRDLHHRLCLLQGLSDDLRLNTEKLGSLCQCAMAALDELLPTHRLAPLLRCLLRKESSISLSQVKSVLEFSLWGPSDVALGVQLRDRELALQRWLDLERATVLHGLVGTRVQLSVLEECHLLFLVRSSAKMMCEAAHLLESNGVS